MPGTLTPAQDYDHLIEAKAGSDRMHDLHYTAEAASGQDWDRGALVSLNAAGALVTGCGDHDMPMWAINATDDFDVDSDIGNFISNKIACWVATGGYELFTTEYKTTETFAPNDLLTAGLTTDLGLVKLAETAHSDAVVVGCVSSGVATDVYSQSILNFWPIFIPKVVTA